MIDLLEGVDLATDWANVIGGDSILNMSVKLHSLHKLATAVKNEVNSWLFVFGCSAQFSFLRIHFSKMLFLFVAFEIFCLNWMMVGSDLTSSTSCFWCQFWSFSF